MTITKEQIHITSKIINLIGIEKYSKSELSIILGISRPTLDKRMLYKNWKKGELSIAKTL